MSSLLSWERGLKYECKARRVKKHEVAPLVGAWIEINLLYSRATFLFVAPLVGAWIEIKKSLSSSKLISVAPLVGAWIEI